jgi:xanthine dehydrogenase small subunit
MSHTGLPIPHESATGLLLGTPWDHSAVRRAQQAVASALKPLSDHRGSAAYGLAVAQTL